ncbi:hypothetical protein [Acidiplasma cupricumulans]|nr:hypothetical protein [Acidiplasma cupricumulans]
MSKFLILISVFLVILSGFIYAIYYIFEPYNAIFKAGILLIILGYLFYIINNIMFFRLNKFEISDKLIFFSVIMFFVFFISQIFMDASLKIGIAGGITGIVGTILAVLYYYFKKDEIISRVIIIVATVLIYISIETFPLGFYSSIMPLYFNSSLWAQAFIIFEIFYVLAFLFKDNSLLNDFLRSTGVELGILIFGVGMITGGSYLISAYTMIIPHGISIPVEILMILAGIAIIIAGIFAIILAFMDFYYEVIRPRRYSFRF